MRAHIMNGDVIANTIEVDSLDVIPNLIDAAIGGQIGDRIVSGAVIPAPPAILTKAEIQEKIDQIERDTLENRGAREIHMRLIEREAADRETATGVPAATILAAVPYYGRLVAINAQIATLRTEWMTAP